MAGSLHLQASCIKQLAGNIPWNEYVSEDYKEKTNELLHRLEKEDSIIRGLNLASKWDIKELTVNSDSKSTVGWLNAVLKEEYRVKTRRISQLLVQRPLNTIREVTKNIKIIVQWIPSELNLANRLSRIPQKWCRTACATGLI